MTPRACGGHRLARWDLCDSDRGGAGEGSGTIWRPADLHALADLLADLAPADLTSEHLDQLEALERIKAAAAAAQVTVSAAFADAAEDEPVPATGRRTPPRAMSIGAEVALATLSSPHAGEQRVLLSRRLRDDLPLTLTALARGELTEHRAFAVAREVAHLTPISAVGSTTTWRRDWRAWATSGCVRRSADPAWPWRPRPRPAATCEPGPPLLGGPTGAPDFSPLELQLASTFTLAS